MTLTKERLNGIDVEPHVIENASSWLNEQPRLFVLDPNLSGLIKVVLEMLITQKANILRQINSQQVKTIADMLLSILEDQDTMILELMSIMVSKAEVTVPLSIDELVTWRHEADELLRETMLKFLG